MQFLTQFLRLIFSYLCPNAVFHDDEFLPIFKITDKAITDHKNRDKKNGFSGEVFIFREVRKFLRRNMPTQYRVATTDAALNVISDAVEHSTTHFVLDPSVLIKQFTRHSTTFGASKKASIIKSKKPGWTDVSGG